ncbi:hypothetical protein [Thiomonas sp.]
MQRTPLSDEKIEHLLQEFRVLAEQFAQAKATRVKFEEARKIRKARLMVQAEADAGIVSAQKQERYAYAHADYAETVRNLVAAVEQETSLYWKMESLRLEFDAWRSLAASERYEKSAYGVPPTGAAPRKGGDSDRRLPAVSVPGSRPAAGDGLL